jgi:hypothetical protein
MMCILFTSCADTDGMPTYSDHVFFSLYIVTTNLYSRNGAAVATFALQLAR